VNEVKVHNQSAPFERLHALVRKGYSAALGTETEDGSIILKHLGKAPDLILRPDGTIVEYDGRRPWHKRHVSSPGRIPAERDADHLQFMKFLETVPKATLRDRTRPWRKKYIYVPALLLIFWGLSLLFTVTISGGM
jgi:hypothetical protein